MEIIKVEDLVRNYRKSILKENENDVKVLKKISFDVYKGEFVGIMGKSGCGKTTLLKTLGMIDKPNEGKIYLWVKILVDFVEINLRILGIKK